MSDERTLDERIEATGGYGYKATVPGETLGEKRAKAQAACAIGVGRTGCDHNGDECTMACKAKAEKKKCEKCGGRAGPAHTCLIQEKDDCQVCHGENGGVKGNENILDGVVMCDVCTAGWMGPTLGEKRKRGTPITLEAARLKALEQVKYARKHAADGIEEFEQATELQAEDSVHVVVPDVRLLAQITKHLADIRSIAFSWQVTAQGRKDTIDRQAKKLETIANICAATDDNSSK